MPRLTKTKAKLILAQSNIDADCSVDFHRLESSEVSLLLEQADLVRYRVPKNANGSRGRYFYAYVCRVASKS